MMHDILCAEWIGSLGSACSSPYTDNDSLHPADALLRAGGSQRRECRNSLYKPTLRGYGLDGRISYTIVVRWPPFDWVPMTW
jgi:hypothetical protein